MGIVSCLGNTLGEVKQALHERRSGVRFMPDYADLGFRSRVAGVPDLSQEEPIDRKKRRYMGNVAIYAWHAARHAIEDAGFTPSQLSNPRIGLIVGSGVGSLLQHSAAVDILRARGIDKVPPYVVPQTMASTASACLATALGIQGISYSISSACATSSHCIGHAAELIRFGQQDVVIAGGAEEVCWTSTMAFDAMGALSARYNECPTEASRPFDKGRDGFVIAGGAGILILEELTHARARGARIHGEVVGYGACSSSGDMVAAAPEGPARSMRSAMAQAGVRIDYINAHATSTPAGDASEAVAIRDVFGEALPLVSSTKGITGHPIGASGAHEAIFCLLMLQGQFIAACANLAEPDRELREIPLVRETMPRCVSTIMSNSFGFGGANVSLIFAGWQG